MPSHVPNPAFDFKHLYYDPSKQASSGFPMGRIRSFWGHGLTTGKMYGVFSKTKVGGAHYPPFNSSSNSFLDNYHTDHRLSLEALKAGINPIEKLAEKIFALVDLHIREHILRNHTDPRKLEIIRLTKLLIQSRGPTLSSEHRVGKLSVFDTVAGMTVRLFQPENEGRIPPHDLVYSTTQGFTPKYILNLAEAPMIEGTWDPEFVDEALDLLRRAVVLEELAEVGRPDAGI